MPAQASGIKLDEFIATVAQAVASTDGVTPQFIEADTDNASIARSYPWRGGYTIGLIAPPVQPMAQSALGAPASGALSADIAKAIQLAMSIRPQSVVGNVGMEGSGQDIQARSYAGAGAPDPRIQELTNQQLLTTEELASIQAGLEEVAAHPESHLVQVSKLALAVVRGEFKSPLALAIAQVLASIPVAVTSTSEGGEQPSPQLFELDPSKMWEGCMLGAAVGAVLSGPPGAVGGCIVGAYGSYVFGGR